MNPRALVFDAYGTLFDVHSVAQRCESFWPAQAPRSRNCGAQAARVDLAEKPDAPLRSFLASDPRCARVRVRSARLALDEKKDGALMQNIWRSRCIRTCAPPRHAAHRRHKLAILTNGSPDMIQPLVAHSGLAFDACSASTSKVFKPAPEVYVLAAKRLGCRPANSASSRRTAGTRSREIVRIPGLVDQSHRRTARSARFRARMDPRWLANLPARSRMKFCSNCAAPVVQRVPPGDSLPRYICDSCGEIHYQNPRMVVGTVPEWEGRLLLCRRAIEPRYGYWTLPAGFMENGETVAAGAACAKRSRKPARGSRWAKRSR
jgi:2-haloalkanoic acid dehalogenase type II